MKTEAHLQAHLFRRAREHDIYCRKMASVGRVGFPDVLLARAGRVVFVELKSPSGTGTLSEMQKREIRRLKDAGAQVYVVDSKEGVENVIRQIADA